MSETTSPWIINTTDETFAEDVIERSQTVAVVVDFWATWCQPCRMLAPVLEKLTEEFDGQFVLVKADGDHCPQATAEFQVQAYPTVYGVRNGQAVDFFEGVLPEEQLRQWLQRLMPSEADNLAAEAKRLAESDPDAAIAKLQQAVELEPNEMAYKLQLAEVLMEAGQLEQAQTIVQELHDAGYETSDVTQLLSAVAVKLSGQQSGGVEACRAACAENPADLSLQLTLAEALTASGEYQEALDLALNAVQADKAAYGDRARDIMVGIFNLLPADSELTHEYRRKLSSALY